MKPTKTLIRGLRETAQRLRDGDSYEWNDMARCNCGLLAQTLLNVSYVELQLCLVESRIPLGAWRMAIDNEVEVCATTGMPLPIILQELEGAGLERSDYVRVERCDEYSCNHKDRHAVAAWMDAEADKLEARRAAGEKPEATP